MRWPFEVSLIIAITAISVSATTRRVPGEYPTLSAAISACAEGDTVLVAPGIYSGRGNRPGAFKSIILRSEDGPRTCIIDGWSPDALSAGATLSFGNKNDGTAVDAVLEGFTITNMDGFGSSGAISCHSMGNISIRDCAITGNRSNVDGAAISISNGTNVTIENCIIAGNRAASAGGAVACSWGNGLFRNCVICGNVAAYGGGIACISGSLRFENSIIADNRSLLLKGNQAYIGLAGGACKITGCPVGDIVFSYCRIEDDASSLCDENPRSSAPGPVYHITNCTEADPGFVRTGYWAGNNTPAYLNDDFWVEGDYHLKSQAGRWDAVGGRWIQDAETSPCIDAGDPDYSIGNEPFPNGGTINMGAYGGTAEASKSYFGKPPCEAHAAGDINGDCRVDAEDLAILSRDWLKGAERDTPKPPIRSIR